MATTSTPQESLVDDAGVWFGISVGLVIATFLVAGLSHLGTDETAAAVLAVAGFCAVRLSASIAASLGVVAWAFYTGFVEHQFGQLTFTAGDLVRLAGFAAATALVAGALRLYVLSGRVTSDE